MPYVLDASIAGCWCFPDERDPRAEAAVDLLDEERALVPLHWWFEIRNVVLLGARRSRITEEHALRFLVRLNSLPIDLARLPGDAAVYALAREHRLTFYDACYLELAKREKVSLATLDVALASAAAAEGVPLVGSS